MKQTTAAALLAALLVVATIPVFNSIFRNSDSTLEELRGPASERDLSSQGERTETYKFADGYGEYSGQGPTKIAAKKGAWESCVQQKIDAYESRNGGQVPDPDTADLFIDACINR